MNRMSFPKGVAALACILAAATLSARTIGSVAAVTSGGATTGYTVSFGAAGANETNVLYLVWGTADAGTSEVTDWEHAVLLETIPPETTQYAYTLTSDVKGPFLRFILAPVQPYDTAVEYLESKDNGAYVQTGFHPTGDSVVEAGVTLTAAGASNNGCIFCARQGGSDLAAKTFTLFRIGFSPRFDYNGTGGTGGSALTVNTPYTFRADYTGISVNGAKYTTGYGTLKSFTAGGPLTLFASYQTESHVPDGNWQRMRLATFKVWSDTAATSLAMDLVPCKKNGSPALYDKVSGTFLTLTGSFATGPETGAAAGETSYSELQILSRRIIIAQGGAITGTVSPAYGTAVPATDAALVCTASPVVDARHVAMSCTGYTLETWNGTAWSAPVAHDGETSYTYPAADTDVKRLTWQWARAVEAGWENNVVLIGDAGAAALVVDNAEKAWFKDWLAAKGLTAATACTYDEIRYAGAGEITNVSEIAAYTGVVRVKEGAQVVAAAGNAFGAAASVTLHVEKGGCVRIWSAAKNGTLLRVKTAYLAGTGRDGQGALYSTCPGDSKTVWPLNIVLADDARIGWQNGNQDVNGVSFDLNGHDLNFLSRNNSFDRLGGGSSFKDSSVANNGRVIVDYAMLFEGTVTYCTTGIHELVFRTNGHYRTNGGHGYNVGGEWTNHWKMVMAGPNTGTWPSFHAGISRNGWCAPVELRCDSALYRQNNYSSQTFFGPISGTYGLGAGGCHSLTWWRFANPANTFTGGISLGNDCYLSAWVDGAIPAFDGAGPVTFTDGSTFWLTDGVEYHLPDLLLDGASLAYTGMVHGASSGAFKTVVKNDATLMNWRSGTGADVLDLRKGVFRIPSPLAGLYEGFTNIANAAAANRAAVTNTVQFTPLAMKFEGNVNYRTDRGTTGTYRGYLWNRTGADVTWGFACSQNSTFCMYIDDEKVLNQTNADVPVFARKTLAPGAHAFEIRYQGNTTQGKKVNNVYPWSDQYKGWGVDRVRAGERTNTTDYVVVSDPGDGSLFTLAKTIDELPAACRLTPPVFKTLVVTNLTGKPVLDLCGNALTVTNVVGAPIVTNMAVGVAADTFTVAGSWTLATQAGTGGKRTGIGPARVTGTLVLGTDAAPITIDADAPASLDRTQEFTLVTADTLDVKGRPALSADLASAHWHARLAPDGKSLVLFHSAGTSLLVR